MGRGHWDSLRPGVENQPSAHPLVVGSGSSWDVSAVPVGCLYQRRSSSQHGVEPTRHGTVWVSVLSSQRAGMDEMKHVNHQSLDSVVNCFVFNCYCNIFWLFF